LLNICHKDQKLLGKRPEPKWSIGLEEHDSRLDARTSERHENNQEKVMGLGEQQCHASLGPRRKEQGKISAI